MLLLRYLAALALTLAVEVPLYTLALRWGWRIRWRPATAAAAGVNLLTHPPLWWLLLPLASHPWYGWFLLAAEGVVCVVEWLLIATWLGRLGSDRLGSDRRGRFPLRWDPLLLVLCVAANGSSVLVGLLAFRLIGSGG